MEKKKGFVLLAKRLVLFVIVILSVFLTACSDSNSKEKNRSWNGIGSQTDSGSSSQAGSLHIVCTTFPQYDWTRQILGENPGQVKLTYLLKNGVDMHSYQPSAEDIIAISDCDLLIYVGGQSEQWLADVQKNRRNQNQKGINMMEILGERVWEEELVEGMQKEEHEHSDYGGMQKEEQEYSGDFEQNEVEYDEHVWLSFQNAERICQEILDVLGELDSVNQEIYQKNCTAYLEQLQRLDKNYRDLVDQAKQKTILVADRFPFRYLTEDYGLDYYAAFAGCSAETEASFETIAFLAAKVDALDLPVIYRIETSDDSLARTVVNSTVQKNQTILVLDSLQAVTEKEIEEGMTYLSVMEQNLERLKQGLLE